VLEPSLDDPARRYAPGHVFTTIRHRFGAHLLVVVALGALCVVILLALNGCVTPIDTHWVDAQTAGRCKLQAYQEDQQNASMARRGAIGMAIIQSNENTRRQEIFDASLEAGVSSNETALSSDPGRGPACAISGVGYLRQ
jgi:hypothetical protein